MRERVLTFGSHRGLVGVLCEPDTAPLARLPGLLLFNVGLNHRVGPGRLNVDLSRRLAGLGFTCLRFDLSGLGDSETRRETLGESERAVRDLKEAMDVLQQRNGLGSFLVMGLCSGTDGAHAAALEDSRVAGAIFVDGYTYATTGYRWRRLLEKTSWLFLPFRWKRWVLWRLRWMNARSGGGDFETRVAEPIFIRPYPPRKAWRMDLERLLARGVRLLFIYTRDAGQFNHAEQFARMLDWRELPAGVEAEYWHDADHLFRTLESRQRLIARVVAWVENWFPGCAAEPDRKRDAS